MDTAGLFTMLDSTIDKIYSVAARYGVPVVVDKEELKKKVRTAAFSKEHPDTSIIYKFMRGESAVDPVKLNRFKDDFKKIMQDVVSLMNRYAADVEVNARAVVQTLATSVKVAEAGPNSCPNCKVEFEDNGSGICPVCKYQSADMNASSVNSLGATPSARLVKRKPTLTKEVLEVCHVAWRGSEPDICESGRSNSHPTHMPRSRRTTPSNGNG